MESYRQQKIQKLEESVDARLKPDLVQTIALRDNVLENHKVLPDTRRIFVDAGLGFHVKYFTWSEALRYISQREEKLEREIEDYTNRIALIKSHIKRVCEGIRELLQLPAENPVSVLNF